MPFLTPNQQCQSNKEKTIRFSIIQYIHSWLFFFLRSQWVRLDTRGSLGIALSRFLKVICCSPTTLKHWNKNPKISNTNVKVRSVLIITIFNHNWLKQVDIMLLYHKWTFIAYLIADSLSILALRVSCSISSSMASSNFCSWPSFSWQTCDIICIKNQRQLWSARGRYQLCSTHHILAREAETGTCSTLLRQADSQNS